MRTSELIKETLKYYSIRDMNEFNGTTGFMWIDCDNRISNQIFSDYDTALFNAIDDYCAIMTENSYFK